MDDTPPKAEERYRAMLMQRTGEERLIMGGAMRDTARLRGGVPAGAEPTCHGGRHPQRALPPLLRP